jgi:N-acetylneuraminate lyase
MVQKRFTGLLAAAVTPLSPDGSVNVAQVRPLVDHLVRNQVNGLFVCGSTGEGPLLTSEERRATASAFVEAAQGRLPVIVHVGHSSPAEARKLAEHAQNVGADAIAAVPPWYFKPESIDQLIGCLAEIAAGAPQLPFYYYHIPSRTGVCLDLLDLLQRGPERIPTLAGAKYTATTVGEFQALVAYAGGRFDLLYGCDDMLLAGLAAGARGAVGTTYNYATPLFQRLIAAFQAGDIAAARNFQTQAISMCRILLPYGGIPASKAIMKFLGVDCGPARLPLVQLSPAAEQSLKAELEAVDFFDWIKLP